MCKCSITSDPSPSNTPPNDFTVEVAVRSSSPASQESDDISMLNLRQGVGAGGEEGSTGTQDSDSTSSQAALLRVEVVPYSPQVELNLPLTSSPTEQDTWVTHTPFLSLTSASRTLTLCIAVPFLLNLVCLYCILRVLLFCLFLSLALRGHTFFFFFFSSQFICLFEKTLTLNGDGHNNTIMVFEV